MKKNYVKPTMIPIRAEYETCILASSVQTENKDFTVKTGNYEIEGNWLGSTATFDTNFE